VGDAYNKPSLYNLPLTLNIIRTPLNKHAAMRTKYSTTIKQRLQIPTKRYVFTQTEQYYTKLCTQRHTTNKLEILMLKETSSRRKTKWKKGHRYKDRDRTGI
jgi:hypothetical protein